MIVYRNDHLPCWLLRAAQSTTKTKSILAHSKSLSRLGMLPDLLTAFMIQQTKELRLWCGNWMITGRWTKRLSWWTRRMQSWIMTPSNTIWVQLSPSSKWRATPSSASSRCEWGHPPLRTSDATSWKTDADNSCLATMQTSSIILEEVHQQQSTNKQDLDSTRLRPRNRQELSLRFSSMERRIMPK